MSIKIENTQITELPPSIGDFGDIITVLDVGTNKLVKFPNSLCKLRNLREIWATHNKITKLPSKMGELINIKVLRLCDNKLSSLPPSMSAMVKLEDLVIHENNFNHIPDCVRYFTNLNMLCMDNNKITEIPEFVFGIKTLTWLTLGNNKISKLSDRIGKLKKLECLVISNNLLTYIPNTISKLKALEQLIICGNNINQLPTYILNTRISNFIFDSTPLEKCAFNDNFYVTLHRDYNVRHEHHTRNWVKYVAEKQYCLKYLGAVLDCDAPILEAINIGWEYKGLYLVSQDTEKCTYCVPSDDEDDSD
jgi:Leucine-rich repeat (LRR) protein